jgi:sporulation protein YlmC with PRC-barrel domain
MDHPKRELKWIDADDLDESGQKLSGLPVRGSDGTTLGEVEGFVIDVREGQPRHVGVAAGWFIHKHFLLPVGHVALSGDGTELVADISKEHVERFPGFDKDEFDKLDSADLDRLDQTMTGLWADGNGAGEAAPFGVPSWWQEEFYRDRSGSRS